MRKLKLPLIIITGIVLAILLICLGIKYIKNENLEYANSHYLGKPYGPVESVPLSPEVYSKIGFELYFIIMISILILVAMLKFSHTINDFMQSRREKNEKKKFNQKDVRVHGNIQSLLELLKKNKKIERIDIFGRNIPYLPDDLFLLPNLKSIRLYHMNVKELPPSIGECTTLEILELKWCKIKRIPSDLAKCNRLRMLVLYQVPLKQIPEEIENLKCLEEVFLEYIPLSRLPDTFVNLPNLQKIHIHTDFFTHLPKTIGNLKNLRSLTINSRNFHSIPESIGNLTNLRKLEIQNAPLKHFPRSIEELPNITNLTFRNCGLIRLPRHVCKLRSLKKLDLGENDLIDLPLELGCLKHLEWIIVDHNPLLRTPIALGGLERLERVDLTDTDVDPKWLHKNTWHNFNHQWILPKPIKKCLREFYNWNPVDLLTRLRNNQQMTDLDKNHPDLGKYIHQILWICQKERLDNFAVRVFKKFVEKKYSRIIPDAEILSKNHDSTTVSFQKKIFL